MFNKNYRNPEDFIHFARSELIPDKRIGDPAGYTSPKTLVERIRRIGYSRALVLADEDMSKRKGDPPMKTKIKSQTNSSIPWMSGTQRAFLCILCFVILSPPSLWTQQRYPGDTWEQAEKSEDLGYSSERLAEAREFTEGLKTAAVVIVVDGVILDQWGEITTKYIVHSIRKSFLSALYGNYVRDGTVDLDATMKDLGIDDKEPSLTEEEKTATVRELLKARSGIYHDAAAESPGMKALKPKRHSHKPGTFWYYNNWDFNALGTIFEQRTNKNIYEAFKEDIADPIGMEDFRPEDGTKSGILESIHQAYHFRMTARDMARFGLLMLRKGNWNGKQIIPEEWIEESTRAYSDARLYGSDAYGYMWWVADDGHKYKHMPGVNLREGTYSARGYGGHYIFVIPDRDMVVVHRVNTYIRGNSVPASAVGKLLRLIFEAKLD
ncbi:MAG: serine hydrolase [Candidatus Aminicenantes bacterium]